MNTDFLYRKNKANQFLISIAAICLVSAVCFFLQTYIGYRVVAYLLLVTVSLIAMFFDIFPVLLASLLSALIWDFFFIPPKFTFYIGSTEDALMLLMYFLIAVLNAVLTFKIRQAEKAIMKKQEEEHTIKLYNTLLNSLSHELRTPIAAIIGATDTLNDEQKKLSEVNKEELVSEISKASFRLNRQVENLLNMSRLESGTLKLKLDWCDIGELVYDVTNRLKEITRGHTVKIDLQENLPLFKLDYGLMEQALYNLIQNAAIYTPYGTTVNISARDKNSELILVVEDNGKGFPEGELKKVFDKFYRLENTNTGGTGLGLSIVKGFVEAHNGKVILENRKEGGARFTIEIPCETTFPNSLKNE